ncbi:MAG: hypothetical protein KC486_01215 [Myxococcales bacterium]|nr:hypothetical protein [Myxococcales bacterium]
MSALSRVLGAPGLWISLLAAQLAIAIALSRSLALLIAAAVQPYVVEQPGRLLPAYAELFADNFPVAIAVVVALATAAALGALLWIVASGGIIRRLAAPLRAGEIAAAAVRHLPGMAMLSIYSAILRALLLANLWIDVLGLGSGVARGVLVAIGWTLCTVAVDLARADVVLRGAKSYQPRTLVRAFTLAVTRPTVWLSSGALTLVGIGLSLTSVAIATRTFGDAGVALWGVRSLAALGVGATLWRIAIAVAAIESAPAVEAVSESDDAA